MMGERDFNNMQAAVLRQIADEEARRNPIFYKGEFREEEWFSLLNSGELISKNTLRNQMGDGSYLCIVYQINRLGWATIEQIENCRWAITPEGLERARKEIEKDECVPYTLVTKKETAYEYFKRKRDELDEHVDKIAAEHRERSEKKEKPAWFRDLINGKICIVFSAQCEYYAFRLDYSDILLLPFCRDIYSSHPEIIENKWPVVIHSAGNPSSQESMVWSIAQTGYRNNRLISGREWFEYDELGHYDFAKTCNGGWPFASLIRGKNASAPEKGYGNWSGRFA